jgi:hypothetical protein
MITKCHFSTSKMSCVRVCNADLKMTHKNNSIIALQEVRLKASRLLSFLEGDIEMHEDESILCTASIYSLVAFKRDGWWASAIYTDTLTI